MCGIFSLLNNDTTFTTQYIEAQFQKGSARGPDKSSISSVSVKTIFGFHRLAINGLDEESNQPIRHHDITLICNGEIYNYRELYRHMEIEPNTNSDCEVILHLYEKYGIDQTLQMLDGVFSFILLDNRLGFLSSKLYVARDPYGVRPLFWIHRNSKKTRALIESVFDVEESDIIAFASEVKVLSDIYHDLQNTPQKNPEKYKIDPFPPGTYMEFDMPWKVSTSWSLVKTVKYHSTGFGSLISKYQSVEDEELAVIKGIQDHFRSAVFKRCSTTDRKIACLLSGGLDSSLVTALVSEYQRINNLPPVETYSIGLEGSEDLKYARQVADYLGTIHTEIIVSEQNFIDAVPDVIKSIESYDTTTVRASIGNWLLGKYIAANSEAKVIFNGDGSDELCGGYLYMHACPNAVEFDKESRRLLQDLHYFDVLRSDRSISSHGLEPRTPFLDRGWVQYYLSISPAMRCHINHGKKKKYLLRLAFSTDHFTNGLGKDLLPTDILWRKKEAFSDGVTGITRSLFQILQEYAENTESERYRMDFSHNPPTTAEQRWYRYIFELDYYGLGHLIPYFWMPKYVEAKDASARTLSIY